MRVCVCVRACVCACIYMYLCMHIHVFVDIFIVQIRIHVQCVRTLYNVFTMYIKMIFSAHIYTMFNHHRQPPEPTVKSSIFLAKRD